MKSLRFVGGSVLLVSVLLIGYGPAAFAESKTLVYCSEASPSSFNPQLATDAPSFNASAHTVYNRLVEFGRGSTKLVPALAESWQVSRDGRTYTFKLRKGVKFHTTEFFKPTREFSADDVAFTWDRMRLKTHPFHAVSGGSYKYFESTGVAANLANVEKVDPYTIRITLKSPDATFLATIATQWASILSGEYGEALLKKGTPEKLDQEPVGTGPFVFKRYSKDTTIRFTAHPDYWEGKAPLDQLVFTITPDPSVRFQKLRTGECQFIALPSPNDLPAMKGDPSLQVMELSGLNVGYVAMNTEKKPFNDIRVRQAMNHAINKKAMIGAIYLGNAVTAKNPIPPTIWSYNQKTVEYDYSVEKARKLLKEAGVAEGTEIEMWTLPVSRPYNPNGRKMGEMIQSDLAKVGLKVKLLTFDWPTYLAKTSKGEHQMAQMGWTGDNGDPDNFLNVLLGCGSVTGGNNLARWCDKKFDSLVQKARLVTDLKQRSRLYEDAQSVFRDQAPWIPVAHATVYRAMSRKVAGYRMDPFGTDQFYGVDLKGPGAK